MRDLDLAAIPVPPGRIHVLPEILANQIAAGEVVERPASVVKELVENALDAGAQRIVVELEEGGTRLVRVSDDGRGMAAEDAPLAFLRHATSKIRQQDDLWRIGTLGFRGEALPSIAAVAAVELTTRTADTPTGVTVRAEGGRVVDVREAGTPIGTIVTVRDLFAPVPARRKFLKSLQTELGHIVDVLTRASLGVPHVHVRLVHQGREIAAHPPVATLAERARQIFGADRVRGGRAFVDERLGLAIEGFAFSPHLSFATARYVYQYVNGRPIRDRALQHAVAEGYASLVPRGRWPGAVVKLAMPPADVDVNVHPAKHEVRFRLAHVVHDTVLGAVRRALAGATGRSEAGETTGVAAALRTYALRPASAPPFFPTGTRSGASPSAPTDAPNVAETAAAAAPFAPPEALAARAAPRGGFAALRFVGQVFRGYLVCEAADRVVLIDQHAAHERVAFERLRAQHAAGAIERQALLLPLPVDLDPGQREALTAYGADLTALGFEIEPFGEGTFLVRAVPALLGDDDPRLLLEDLADGLAEVGSHCSAAEAFETVLGRIACHSVIRVGRALAAPEAAQLLADLDALAYGSNCPHGRPVSVEFTRGQIERMFGR
ncbi:MAG: DNA mismatch repair endonuclease MutL [Deltaproteobacteria bacterium]|nr:DNA mismatch repair endonuclease MutL [Deltaproteobacteria bacterium]